MGKGWPKVVLVLGASGIVGQHLRLHQPDEVDAIYHRRTPDHPYFIDCDFQTLEDVRRFLTVCGKPDVIINLAGENRPDVVEKHPAATEFINIELPTILADWCAFNESRLIQVSTQGVFSGLLPPYQAYSVHADFETVNHYGWQKWRVEQLLGIYPVTIARLTFVLGIQFAPRLARQNPMERWCGHAPIQEVMDRFFSPCTARDAAVQLWHLALMKHDLRVDVYHIGHPLTFSRYGLAKIVRALSNDIVPIPVLHCSFEGIAERPRDTSFASDCLNTGDFSEQLITMVNEWSHRMDYLDLDDRAAELSTYFRRDIGTMKAQLKAGFHHFHQQVAESFRNAAVGSDKDLLEWYRQTTAYIWELTAYHIDPGFNYMGMCEGIRNHLLSLRGKTSSDNGLINVLCLGDGIGDLSLFLNDAPQFAGFYHDLAGSKTWEFAAMRYWRRYGSSLESRFVTSIDWMPPTTQESMDAVIALDFFEHLPNVEQWVAHLYDYVLAPGGLFMAQNAFGIGDDEHEGSIPMHLTRNNHYVTDWDPLLERIGFLREPGGWWRKPGHVVHGSSR